MRRLAATLLAAAAIAGAAGCGGDSPAQQLEDANDQVDDAQRRVDLVACDRYSAPSERQACRDEVNAR